MTHYVYLVQCGPYIKVGHAANVEKRVADIRIGNPFDLKIVHKYKFRERYDAEIGERTAQEAVRYRHHRGEWYRVSARRAVRSTTSFLVQSFMYIDGEFVRASKWSPPAEEVYLRELAVKLSEESPMPDHHETFRGRRLNPVASAEIEMAWVGCLSRKLLKHGIVISRWNRKVFDITFTGFSESESRWRRNARDVRDQLERISGRQVNSVNAIPESYTAEEVLDEEVHALAQGHVPSVPHTWRAGWYGSLGGVGVFRVPSKAAISAIMGAWLAGYGAQQIIDMATDLDPADEPRVCDPLAT